LVGLAVQEREPSAQLPGRFVRCLSVERHQRRAPARDPGNLRTPPAEADAGYLDEVLAAIDDLFETMHVFAVR
jgi:hypothetical protein